MSARAPQIAGLFSVCSRFRCARSLHRREIRLSTGSMEANPRRRNLFGLRVVFAVAVSAALL